MKKVKLLFISSALLLAVGGALANKIHDQVCFGFDQYYLSGSAYYPAGIFGVTYVCLDYPIITCTYYRPNPISQPNVYVPCLTGQYYMVQAH